MDMMMLLAAIGGGILGAVWGPLISFIFAGFAILVGICITLAGGPPDVVLSIGFGSVFGPHIGFAGGLFATAYAGRIKALDSGANILAPLAALNKPMVLLMGGIGGALGYVLVTVYGTFMKIPTDTIALAVVTIGIIARLVFGTTGLTGKTPEGTVRSYFPVGNDLVHTIILSFGLSLVIAIVLKPLIEIAPLAAYLGFSLSAISLLFTELGQPVPGTHHVTIIAGIAVAATGNIAIAVALGVLSGIIGDFAGRTFNSHADAHIDPPAFAIAIMTAVVMAWPK